MKTSENGFSLIKKYEGCQLKAYRCSAGVWTIGYGHTLNVKKNDIITNQQAEDFLKEDLQKFEKNVERYRYKYDWTQNEFDALVSFAFNIGSIDKLTAEGTRSKKEIAEKMLCYNRVGKKELPGLTKRRAAERDLFLTKVAPVQQISATVQGAGVIRAVQVWLNKEYRNKIMNCTACGKELLQEDGKYGKKTKAALTIALQTWLNSFRDSSIKVDGIFENQTKAVCKSVSERTNKNTRGAQIVQAILYCNGYNPQLFAENFNADCTKAVRKYQEDHALTPDGIAGPKFFESALK